MTYSHVTKLEKWAPIETDFRQSEWWKLCVKWVDPCAELFSGTRAFVKLSLYGPCGAVHSGNFTPDLPSASSTSGCGPPQLGCLGNRVKASPAVGSSMLKLLTAFCIYIRWTRWNYTQIWKKAWRLLSILSSKHELEDFFLFSCLTATKSNLVIFHHNTNLQDWFRIKINNPHHPKKVLYCTYTSLHI